MSSSTASEGYLTETLNNARKSLLKKGLYLGVPGVMSRLEWHRVGKVHYLSTAEDVKNALARNAELDPNAPSTEVEAPSYAVLSAVVFIPPEGYWLTSDGMWRGPENGFAFSQVKPTCTGAAPRHPVFSDDFASVLSNMDNIMEDARTSSDTEMKGTIVKSRSTGERKLKFRHVLFEV